jgi:hypothetical protein
VENKRTVLIVTDGSASLKKAADAIAAELEGFQVLIRPAESFAGTDLLPACAFFLGCERPNQSSFAYLGAMLEHISLAGRSCGLFSSDKQALKYLSGLVKDCEAAVGDPLLLKGGDIGSAVLKKWLRNIIKESR